MLPLRAVLLTTVMTVTTKVVMTLSVPSVMNYSLTTINYVTSYMDSLLGTSKTKMID
jgi:hypothetical protein